MKVRKFLFQLRKFLFQKTSRLVIQTINLAGLVISPDFQSLRRKSKDLGSNYTYIRASLRSNINSMCDQLNMMSISKTSFILIAT